jgi:predicted nuclease with TOPRIM domain
MEVAMLKRLWRYLGLDFQPEVASTGKLLDRTLKAEREYEELGERIKEMRAELEGRDDYNQPQPKLF